MTMRFARWFGRGRRSDLFILRTEAGWQVHGRMGGAGWPEVTYYFDSEEEARALVLRMSGSKPADHRPAARPAYAAEPGLEASS
jgi:hypothetical protein